MTSDTNLTIELIKQKQIELLKLVETLKKQSRNEARAIGKQASALLNEYRAKRKPRRKKGAGRKPLNNSDRDSAR